MSDQSVYSVNMERVRLEESPCDGICLNGAFLKEARFVASSLCGADFSHSLLADADMRYAKMKNAILVGTILRGANLTHVDFTGANLSGADLRGAFLAHASFAGCKYDSHTRFESGVSPSALGMIQVEDVAVLQPGEAEARVDLSGERRLMITHMGGIVAEGANFEGVEFASGRFDYAVLRGANFSGVVAQASFAKGADFREVNFQGADMRGTSLAGTDLSGADLRGANFERAGFMATTVLKGANLCGANLEQIVHRNVDYTGAIYDAHTRWGKTTLVPGVYGVAPAWIAEEHSGATKVDG